jgi:hypothetical protein
VNPFGHYASGGRRFPWVDALEVAVAGWMGTPYMAGARMPGRRGGVDCANFVVAVLDELHGLPAAVMAPIESEPEAVIRGMLGRYPHARAPVEEADCGDVVFTRDGRGLGHVLLCGGVACTFYHATRPNGVTRAGLSAASGRVDRVYRLTERERWAITIYK